uniref:Preproalbumin PawS1 n=1 Tax=Wamalchitamia aurantiaca TaxID=243772 RepID=A0A023GYI9_9ASTR|nr:preproalbumin PawS1 [Wamalchitamia aurantiaca]
MAKLVLAAVLALAAMVAFVEVSGYRRTSITTITTITMEDNGHCIQVPPMATEICFSDGLDNPRGVSCDTQVASQQLSHCKMHLTSSNLDYKLRMPAVENPKQKQQEHLSLCCNQLQQVEEQCQCEVIKQVVVEQARKQKQGGQLMMIREVQQMLKKAQMLPNQCNLKCSTTASTSTYMLKLTM